MVSFAVSAGYVSPPAPHAGWPRAHLVRLQQRRGVPPAAAFAHVFQRLGFEFRCKSPRSACHRYRSPVG